MRPLIIINPKSGGMKDLASVAATIRGHPSLEAPEIRITGARDDASLIAREGIRHGFRRVLAVGGDGTFNEVVNGVLSADAGAEVGLLPLGTGNDFARTLGLPLDLGEALDAYATWRSRPVDVVRVESLDGEGSLARHYVNASAGGFSGEVDQENTAERKASWGPLSYLRSALDVIPDPPSYTATLEVEGEERAAEDLVNVVVANGQTVAGGIPIAPGADVADGLLDVVLVRSGPLRELAGFASRCLVGRHLEHDLVVHVQARRVVVRSDPPMPFNLDGELLGETPLLYEVLPGALPVLAPPAAAEGAGQAA